MRILGLILTAIAAAMFALAPSAHAQFEDLGGILEDILGGSQLPGQTPIYGEAGIENIPVIIRYDIKQGFADRMLIVTAYAPSEPSGATKKAKMLGQTRLLLTGLKQPLQLSIPVPRNVTKGLTFSRLTAEVLDENGNQVLTTDRDGLFRGKETPELTLRPTSTLPAASPRPSYSAIETIEGEVSLNDYKARLNGGLLTIQLMENALAGGTSMTIAAEKIINIDTETLPIIFSMDRGLSDELDKTPLAFNAWINDWAGRKTHVMRLPIPYNGPDINYKLKLDVLAQGTDTEAGSNLDPNLMAQAAVSGEALFDANYDIPQGARLKVTLNRAVGAAGQNRLLASQTIILRGLEGRAPFALSTASTHFDPLIPPPILNLKIVDAYDRVYFDSGDVSAREGPQSIQLYPRQ